MRPAAVLSAFVVAAAIAHAQPSRPAARTRSNAPRTESIVVTLVDGAARLLHGASKYALPEGAALQAGDIVEVSDGLVLVERRDGAAAAFAAPARAMVMPSRSPAPPLFVLAGKVKAASPRPEAVVRVESAFGAATLADGVSVIAVSGEEESLFAESGRLTLDGPPPLVLKPGQFCSLGAGRKGAPVVGPPHAFVASLPRPFLDPLPSRLARWAERRAPLGKPESFTYPEVEAWLRAAPAVRRILASEWASKAADPAFRRALLANLSHHPEWNRVLFPEKYETKGQKLP